MKISNSVPRASHSKNQVQIFVESFLKTMKDNMIFQIIIHTFSVQMLSPGVFVNRVLLFGFFSIRKAFGGGFRGHESIFLHSFPNVMYFHGLAQMNLELCYLPRNFFILVRSLEEFGSGFGKINFAEFCPS